MKHILKLILLLSVAVSNGQGGRTLTIDSCYIWARQNYPLINQRDLIEKTRQFTVENAWRGYIPQLNVLAQATYQSQSISFSDAFAAFKNIPGFTNVQFPTFSKDQYRFTGEVNQVIYDAGASRFKKQNAVVQSEIQQQNLEVNLYALRDRINQLYFSILLFDEQLKQNDLQQKDIQSGIAKTQALLENGNAFKSNVDELKAQLLQVQENKLEIISSRKAFLLVLGAFTSQTLDDNTVLARPGSPVLSGEIIRPELKLYDLQKSSYAVQKEQLQTGFLPLINGVFDGSYGRPTLNIISNSFGFFWTAGLHLSWSLSALYTYKNNRNIFSLSQDDLDVQKRTFLFNTNLTMIQQNESIKKYADLLDKDKEIVALRTSVKDASNAQLQNGVITSHDYLTQVDAEAQARLSMILHQIQLLQAQYNYQNTSGN